MAWEAVANAEVAAVMAADMLAVAVVTAWDDATSTVVEDGYGAVEVEQLEIALTTARLL